MDYLEQGQIIKVENIKGELLVVSKELYNKTGSVIVCPIVDNMNEGILQYRIHTEKVSGTVLCDQIKNLDLSVRGYKVLCNIDLLSRMTISDIIQGLIEVT